MDPEVTRVGDQLKDAIERAAVALMHGPQQVVEQALLGPETAAARRAWLDLRADTAMDIRAGEHGDTMSAALGRAAKALQEDDLQGLWTALDAPPTAQACRRWDLLHGRDVPTDAEMDATARAHAGYIRDWMRRSTAA